MKPERSKFSTGRAIKRALVFAAQMLNEACATRDELSALRLVSLGLGAVNGLRLPEDRDAAFLLAGEARHRFSHALDRWIRHHRAQLEERATREAGP